MYEREKNYIHSIVNFPSTPFTSSDPNALKRNGKNLQIYTPRGESANQIDQGSIHCPKPYLLMSIMSYQ